MIYKHKHKALCLTEFVSTGWTCG